MVGGRELPSDGIVMVATPSLTRARQRMKLVSVAGFEGVVADTVGVLEDSLG
jgi:hypothetical protein